MRPAVARILTTALTSATRRDLVRGAHALRRRLRGAAPTIHYFHQADDPYSHLAAQLLGPLARRYRVAVKVWPAPPPDDSAAPDRERLARYALRDAARLAQDRGLDFPAADVIAPATQAELAAGGAERRRLGHYLGAMLYFEGEWYWGVDRLHHLEERLAGLGLDAMPGEAPVAPFRDMILPAGTALGPRATIDFWFSFRSPYSWLAFPRVRRLARHYGAELRPRFILPMVMRGLPVPRIKTIYIALDAKREAERLGMPFGTIVDPVGAGAERALAVMHHALPLGLGEDFAELALKAAFADGIALASDQGLLDVAVRAGLSEAQVRTALADQSWRATAEANREALLEAGLWGPPTYRVNDRPTHWGQDRLWALEQDLAAERRWSSHP